MGLSVPEREAFLASLAKWLSRGYQAFVDDIASGDYRSALDKFQQVNQDIAGEYKTILGKDLAEDEFMPLRHIAISNLKGDGAVYANLKKLFFYISQKGLMNNAEGFMFISSVPMLVAGLHAQSLTLASDDQAFQQGMLFFQGLMAEWDAEYSQKFTDVFQPYIAEVTDKAVPPLKKEGLFASVPSLNLSLPKPTDSEKSYLQQLARWSHRNLHANKMRGPIEDIAERPLLSFDLDVATDRQAMETQINRLVLNCIYRFSSECIENYADDLASRAACLAAEVDNEAAGLEYSEPGSMLSVLQSLQRDIEIEVRGDGQPFPIEETLNEITSQLSQYIQPSLNAGSANPT